MTADRHVRVVGIELRVVGVLVMSHVLNAIVVGRYPDWVKAKPVAYHFVQYLVSEQGKVTRFVPQHDQTVLANPNQDGDGSCQRNENPSRNRRLGPGDANQKTKTHDYGEVAIFCGQVAPVRPVVDSAHLVDLADEFAVPEFPELIVSVLLFDAARFF